MKNSLKSLTVVALASGLPLVASAQTTVFSDNFSSSTLNGASTPGGTPTASSTSYDIASTKGANTGPTIGANDMKLTFNTSTSSGFVEAQALFTSTPITLATIGDYINLTYTFTDTSGSLLAGTSAGSSFIYTGLFNSGGSAPLAGSLNNSGLSSTAGSSFATGGTAGWQGYSANVSGANGSVAGARIVTRAAQTGAAVTSSANQELLASGVGSGAYVNPAGTQLTGGSASAAAALTAAAQYTLSYQITLSAAGTLSVNENLYSGVGTDGTSLISVTGTDSTGLATSFDGFGIGIRHSGGTLNPVMDISQIKVVDSIQAVPEPTTLSLLGGGAALILFLRRRQQQ